MHGSGTLNEKKATQILLHRRWIHSHEEDTDSEVVYRPATFDFPPSRGRAGFELKPDHSYAEIGVSRNDVPQDTAGIWELEDSDNLIISISVQSAPSRKMQVTFVDEGRLVIKRAFPKDEEGD